MIGPASSPAGIFHHLAGPCSPCLFPCDCFPWAQQAQFRTKEKPDGSAFGHGDGHVRLNFAFLIPFYLRVQGIIRYQFFSKITLNRRMMLTVTHYDPYNYVKTWHEHWLQAFVPIHIRRIHYWNYNWSPVTYSSHFHIARSGTSTKRNVYWTNVVSLIS